MSRGKEIAGNKKSFVKRLWRFCWKSALWFFAITIGLVVIYKWINPPTTFIQIVERCDCPQGSTWSKGDWADEVSVNMKLAVVASEDNNFMKHHGIDWGAVEKAKKYNETKGKKNGKTRGASTITQQTAKNVFLWKGNSSITKWIRKGFEVYFTYLIEWIWGKERILEVYLNVIEMGPCRFGVGAAANDYFNTAPAKLTREQAASIAACLPNPKKYSVSKPGSYMQKRQGQIVRLMRMIGDGYFERYGDGVNDEIREKEERETDKKIEAVPKEDLPEKIEQHEESAESEIEEKNEEETPKIEDANEAEKEKDNPSDSIP